MELHVDLKTILDAAVGGLFTRKPPPDAVMAKSLQDPFEQLKQRRAKHPLTQQLRVAYKADQKNKGPFLLNRIRRDG